MLSPRVHFDRMLDKQAPKISTALSRDDKLAVFRQHGNFSLAYSTVAQPGMSYFGDRDGFIAFGSKMGRFFALGDPLADHDNHAVLIEDFVRSGRDPWFVQIGEATARTLAALGYRVNRLGVDTHLNLPGHDFSGRAGATVRYSERWLLRQGYAFVEDDGTRRLAEIEDLSFEWRSTRVVSRWEMTFLNRPFAARLGPDMRRFLLLGPDRRISALIDCDPLFRDGRVRGYTTAFKRKRPDATAHAEVGLTKFMVDRMREEGAAVVTLGLSPLASLQPSGFAESHFWRRAFQSAHDSTLVNRLKFNLKGQSAFKRRFHGAEVPSYIAFRKGTLLEMLALLRLAKAI